MRAILLRRLGDLRTDPDLLHMGTLPDPVPGRGQLLVRVSVCGVCHTELDEVEGRTAPPRLPVVLGHQVVGEVVDRGRGASRISRGQRVGIAWIWQTCGVCTWCRSGRENLCPEFLATGRDVNGGYAEYVLVPEDFAYVLPDVVGDAQAAPLLCAGAIGYRSLRLTGLSNGQTLGLTGFGASGHLVLQLARHQFPDSRIMVIARNAEERSFAMDLGATWAGDTGDRPPEPLDAIIDTTPAWTPVLQALEHLAPGGRLVINAIRKEEADKLALQRLDYPRHLWLEKEVKSVANITRADVQAFLDLAAAIPIVPEVEEYPLEDAARALLDLRERRVRGAKVLRVSRPHDRTGSAHRNFQP